MSVNVYENGTLKQIAGKSKSNTLAGYGITDAKIENGKVILGSESVDVPEIRPYTKEEIDAYFGGA